MTSGRKGKRKVALKEKPTGSQQASVDNEANEVLAALTLVFKHVFQRLPEEELGTTAKSAKSGGEKAVSAMASPERASDTREIGPPQLKARSAMVSPEWASDTREIGPPNLTARSDERPRDLEALLQGFAKQFHVFPEKEDDVKTEVGNAVTGGASAFHAMFQAPLGTGRHDKRQEVDELFYRMRGILHNPNASRNFVVLRKYLDGDRLTPEDEAAVRGVLKYHPNLEEKTGAGIAYIKIQKIFNDVTRCFWVVRIDGTEIDFSIHQSLKNKAARECPGYQENGKHYQPRCRQPFTSGYDTQ